MAIFDVLINYGLPFIVILSILVFVHELGHYAAARWNGVRVEVFSIGFGPEIKGWNDRRGTRWKISCIPMGGYVKMYGEEDADENDGDVPAKSEADSKESFREKTVLQRFSIVFAGPLANFLFAIAVMALLFSVVGRPIPEAGIGYIAPDSSAEKAGFKIGDRILSVDGVDIRWFEDLKREVSARPGIETSFKVVRNGSVTNIVAVMERAEEVGEKGNVVTVGRLGVGPDPAQIGHVRLGPVAALGVSVDRSFQMTWQILSYLGGVVNGTQSADELGGPIRIAQMSGEMAQAGLFSLTFFMAILSLNLALINLFPIPMLDGGHLVFLIAEGLRGRPVTPRIQEYSFRFGLILVLLVLVFATWNDLGEINLFN